MRRMFWSKSRLYADTAATTPLDKKVAEVLTTTTAKIYGNPSSLHVEGVQAEKALAKARADVAKFLKAHSDEVVFTSGGTESNLLAIRGVFEAYHSKYRDQGKRPRIIVGAIEHTSVLETAAWCGRQGAEVVVIPVDSEGKIKLEEFKAALNSETILISVSIVNNEIGTIESIREIAAIIRRFKKTEDFSPCYFHTDACQAPRFLELAVDILGVDLLTINSGKIYGPKGVGALYVRRGTLLSPVLVGGGQEFGLRSGTQNVPAIVAFAAALDLCEKYRSEEVVQLAHLRDRLYQDLQSKFPDLVVYGPTLSRVANNLNIGFPGISGEELVIGLDAQGIAVSTGSACSSRSKPESHVLQALGIPVGASSIRVTLGRETRLADILRIIAAFDKTLARLRVGRNLLHS